MSESSSDRIRTVPAHTGPDQHVAARSTLVPARNLRLVAAAVAVNSALVLLALAVLFPLYWLVSTSFLPREAILSASQTLVVRDPTLENYQELLATTRFARSIWNSVVAAAAVTAAGVYLDTLAGYAFAKHKFRGRDWLFIGVLVTMMIPVAVTVIPNFILLARIRLIGSLWSIILPQLALPFGIFWMRQYIQGAVPDELLESARIDGAGELGVFRLVVLPIVGPGMAGLAIWLFLFSWNAFLLPLAYLQTNEAATYPVFLAALKGFYTPPTHLLVAASVLSTLPVVVVFFVAQRRFISGITAGAVKG